MSTLWEALHRSLVLTARTRSFHRRFQDAQRRHDVLGRFATPQALVAFLSKPRDDIEGKNRLFVALVRMVQQPDEDVERDLAGALLWLALWPGLDARYRWLQHVVREPTELVSDLGKALTQAILALTVDGDDQVHVPVTLLFNVQRRVLEQDRTRRRRSARVALVHDIDDWGDGDESKPGDLSQSHRYDVIDDGFSGFSGFSGSGIDDLLQRLREVCGEDTDLLVSISVLGERQAEAARRLGISRAGAHLRYQRALRLARKYFSRKS